MDLRKPHPRATGLLLVGGVVLTATDGLQGWSRERRRSVVPPSSGPWPSSSESEPRCTERPCRRRGVTRLARTWGSIGSVFAALSVAWLLLARLYGDASGDRGDRLV